MSISEAHREAAGTPLSLTLDANIQQRAEDVLGAVGRVFSPKDATAIVMDPRTGAILAMANWPQVERRTTPGASSPKRCENRAVGFDYEPGSTFKAVTVAGALQQEPDHAEHELLRSPTRSRSPTARSTTTPNTPKRR